MEIHRVDGAFALDDDLVLAGDNQPALDRLPRAMFDLIYMDPPFNTGRAQARHTIAAEHDPSSTRTGFGGRRYRTRLLQSLSYEDEFADYLAFLEPRLTRARDLLAPHGTLYFHIDYREAHYCKLLLDEVFGRDAFLNELIWSYDYGAKPRRRGSWSTRATRFLRSLCGSRRFSRRASSEPTVTGSLALPATGKGFPDHPQIIP